MKMKIYLTQKKNSLGNYNLTEVNTYLCLKYDFLNAVWKNAKV